MCFSATASFTVAAALLPVGIYCLKTARESGAKWVPLSALPLVFAAQQSVEGVLWYGIANGDAAIIQAAGKSFVFFSHFFWLLWLPFSIRQLETGAKRFWLTGLTLFGGLYGASLFLPIAFNENWLSIEIVQRSLEYKTVLIYDGMADRTVLRLVYALVILGALFSSSAPRIRLFGGAILVSFIATYLFFVYAFISVWCFFAAMLSVYILYVLRQERRLIAA